MKKTRYFGAFMALLMVISMLLQGLIGTAHAEGSAKQVDVKVTQLKILNDRKEETNTLFSYSSLYLSMDWDTSQNGANLHEGDYFDITLPDKMKFPTDSTAVDFNLYAPDGTSVMANAHVTPNPDGGGKVRITFTNWVENKYNVKGKIFLSAQFDTTKIAIDSHNTFSITVNSNVTGHSQTIDTGIDITGPKDLDHEYITKWGIPVKGIADQVQWT